MIAIVWPNTIIMVISSDPVFKGAMADMEVKQSDSFSRTKISCVYFDANS